MQLVACQFDIEWENKPANFARVRELLAAANVAADSLVMLPEMFATGFSMATQRIAETRDGETHEFLSSLAKDLRAFVIGGVAVHGASPAKGRNEAWAYNPAGERVISYCKQQPFTIGGEADHYEAGDAPVFFDWQDFRVAPLICYDLRFPELFRAAVDQGANLFPVIANWPQSRAAHWPALLQARAIENQAYVVGVNRTGNDPRLVYRGQTQIIDPHGNVLAESADETCVLTATASLKELTDYRRKFPALKDRKRR